MTSDSRGRHGLLFLVLALILFSASSPVVKLLVRRGASLGLDREAISFCNVLFVGNLVAAILVALRFGPRVLAGHWRSTPGRIKGLVVGNGLIACAAPALIFTALESTSIANVVLLGRVEPPVYALLSVMFLGASMAWTQWLGHGVIVVGVSVLVLLQGEWTIARGDALVLAASALLALSSVMGKRLLSECDTGLFVCARNAISSVVFLGIGSYLYTPQHFADAFGPRLWLLMVAYAGVLVVAAQFFWFRALDALEPSRIAAWSMASPVIAIAFGWLLLGEVPAAIQYAGGAVIIVGLAITQIKTQRAAQSPTPVPEMTLAAAA